jgi:hypothetical protein
VAGVSGLAPRGPWRIAASAAHYSRRETNVVDRFGFSHELPNLGIVGRR